jgi:hypothetical protein
MSADRVYIHELRLRMPGASPAEGRALGEAVAQQLTEALPHATLARTVGGLTLRVTAEVDSAPDVVATRIVAAIVKGLR